MRITTMCSIDVCRDLALSIGQQNEPPALHHTSDINQPNYSIYRTKRGIMKKNAFTSITHIATTKTSIHAHILIYSDCVFVINRRQVCLAYAIHAGSN